ncbi:hypothetical protein B9Z55_001884 [Caenorhabditis nigoni]|uniref:RNA helicase n=2 Tax=Caenorhabditis nigoni TaxID=1611254 RepID=A0A2G5VI33_9PELO|nr:hypothetical protein B9Z55_001884 [Caenorhabditis nigoni]
MSFSDDGWGDIEESEVKVAVEQKNVVPTPDVEKPRMKMETIEEHTTELVPSDPSDAALEPQMADVRPSNEVSLQMGTMKVDSSAAADESDDGWGTPKKGDGFRGPIVTKTTSMLPPVRITRAPVPAASTDDTFDIESPRALSPVQTANNGINSSQAKSAASYPNGSDSQKTSAPFGKFFGTQTKPSVDEVEVKQDSISSEPPKHDKFQTSKSFGSQRTFGDQNEGNASMKAAEQFSSANNPQSDMLKTSSGLPNELEPVSKLESQRFKEIPKTVSFGKSPALEEVAQSGRSEKSGFGFPVESKPNQPDVDEKTKSFGFGREAGFGGPTQPRTFGVNTDSRMNTTSCAPQPDNVSESRNAFGVNANKASSESVRTFGANANATGFGTSGFGTSSASENKAASEPVRTFGANASATGFKSSGFGTSSESANKASSESVGTFGANTSASGFKSSGFGTSSESANKASSGSVRTFGANASATGFGTSGFGTSSVSENKANSESVRTFGANASATGFKSSGFGTSSASVNKASSESVGTFGANASASGFRSSGFGTSAASENKASSGSVSTFGANASATGFGTSGFGTSSVAGGFGSQSAESGNAFGSTAKHYSFRGQSGSDQAADNTFGGNGFGASNTNKPAFGSFGQFKKDDGFDVESTRNGGGWGEDAQNFGGDKPRGCHNCGEEGHFSRECPKPKQPHLPCRNCNEVGHFSKDCDKPKVPFGPCRNCQKEGHFAKDCPEERVRIEPTEPCRRCNEEGHWASECPTRPRDLEGNILVPYDVVFAPEEDMFNEAVNNDDRMNFEQKVVASMGDNVIPDVATFEAFKVLPQEVHDNLIRMKMNRPTPIQKAAFYQILHGHDVVACAHTGSGKTLAFLLPLVINLLEDRLQNYNVKDEKPSPRLLIIAPTRELANQTFNTARQLTYQTGLKCGLAYGGYSRSANLQHLSSFDQLGILVSTMGRLNDFLESGDITLDKMKFIVLDEADRMVDFTDFGEEVNKIIGSPQERTQQTILFSASFSENLQAQDLPKIVKEGYTMLQVDKFGTANVNIDQHILPVPRSEKRSELYKLLGFDENTMSILPDARIEKEKTLIFVNSVKFCDTLASNISSCGVSCISMHSHQNQEQRDRTLDDFRHGKFQCMVASNVCARGLNIAGLDHVINYDMPDKKGFDEYVNRIGRTARAGFTGVSTAFLDEESDREIIPNLVNILQEAGKEVPEWIMNINNQEEEMNEEVEDEQW